MRLKEINKYINVHKVCEFSEIRKKERINICIYIWVMMLNEKIQSKNFI